MQKSLFLLAGAVVAALILAIAVLLHAAGHQDSMEAERSRAQVDAVLTGELDRLTAGVRDYAIWDEAAERIGADDLDWIAHNLNALTLENFGLSALGVIGPDGALLWLRADGDLRRADLGPVAAPAWIDALVRQIGTAAAPMTAQARGLVLDAEGGLTAIAGSAVADEMGRLAGQPGRAPVIVFAKRLDAAALRVLEGRAGVTGLRHAADAARGPDELSAALEGLAGADIGSLAWRAPRPGRDLIAGAAPWLALGAAGVLAATLLLLFRIGEAARELRDGNLRLLAANDESRSIGDAAPFPLAVVRVDTGEIVFANLEMRVLLGLQDERPVGLTIQDVFTDSRLVEDLFESEVEPGDTINRQTTVKGEGESFPAEVIARRSAVGDQSVLILMVRDLRPEIEAARIRRFAEERLLRAEAERARTTILEVETRLLRPLLFEMVAGLLDSGTAQAALATVAETARKATRGQTVVLVRAGLPDGTPMEVALGAAEGMDASTLLSPFVAALDATATAEEMGSPPPIRVSRRAGAGGLAAPKPFRSAVAVKLPGLPGALVLASEEPDAFSDGDVAVLQALAGTAVIALRERPGATPAATDRRTVPA